MSNTPSWQNGNGVGTDERWLLISYWAHTEGMMPSYHVDDRLPYLRQAGITVDVITSVCGTRPEEVSGDWRRVPSVTPTGLRYEIRHAARRWSRPWRSVVKPLLTALLAPGYLLEKGAANLESTFWWWIPAALVGLRQTRRRRPVVIYSTGGPLASHWAAAVVARVRKIPWVAELRDPLPYQLHTRGRLHRWVVARTERMIHARAAGVVYLTQTACERAHARTKDRAACTAIYAGGEYTATPVPPVDTKQLRFLHAGSLAGSRHPGVLLKALQRVVERIPEARGQVRVTLLGSMDKVVHQMIERFAYSELVEVMDKLPRAEAQARIEAAGVLLILQNLDPVSEETIPSKTYDYLVAGKPILGLLHHNLELPALLHQAGHVTVEATDAEQIATALEALYQQWRNGTLRAQPDLRFTRAKATAEFVTWIRTRVSPGTGYPPQTKENEPACADEATSLAPTRKS